MVLDKPLPEIYLPPAFANYADKLLKEKKYLKSMLILGENQKGLKIKAAPLLLRINCRIREL